MFDVWFHTHTHREAYRGALSEEELDALDKAKMEKERAVSALLAREQELRDLRDSQLTSSKVSLFASAYTACMYQYIRVCPG